jgi:hypothetical protein
MRSRNRNRNRFGRNNYENRVHTDRNLYESNARTYYGSDDRDADIYNESDYRDRAGSAWERGEYEGPRGGRDTWRYTRDDRNIFERAGDKIRNTWDRMTNNDDRDFESEYDRDRLEREYGHGSRRGFGYGRYSAEDYGDYRSGADDDFEYAEDLRNRAYDDTRYGRDSGYSDVWRGERNQPQIRRRTAGKRRMFSW